MVRPGEDLCGRAALDDLARGHHADPLGHVAHDRQIVGDQQEGHAEPVAQLAHQIEDLRLDRHVERGRRLVGDQDVGFVGDRHRDHHALALAARELVRIGVEPALGVAQADQVQQFEGASARRRGRHVLVDQERLGDLLFQRVQRVERGHRLLEDHRDAVAAHLAQPRRGGADQSPRRQSGCCFRGCGRRRGRGGAAGPTAPSPILPEPLSPTSARVSPRSRVKETRFTASTGGAPRQPAKVTLRSRTSRRLIGNPIDQVTNISPSPPRKRGPMASDVPVAPRFPLSRE